MPSYPDDEPRIRYGIRKRLEAEKGVKLMDIKIVDKTDHIAVGVEWMIDDLIHGTSLFDLPPVFELGHIHNEVDEIAENMKEARRKFALHNGVMANIGAISERHEARGTGRRGRWVNYGSA